MKLVQSVCCKAEATLHKTLSERTADYWTCNQCGKMCQLERAYPPEPKPQPTGTELRVCEDIAARQQFGIKKYGQTVEQNPLSLREWLEHAYYEALDQAVYLKRAMEEIDNKA